jgi:hypothetical protein
MFPYLYGGSYGDTSFRAFAFDSDGNVAIGGYSDDSSLVGVSY